MKEIRLLPCPYCGAQAYIEIFLMDGKQYITAHHLPKCKMKPDTFLISNGKSVMKQAKAWNMRAWECSEGDEKPKGA